MPGLSEPFRVLKVEGRGIGGVRELGQHSGGRPHWATVFAVADVDATASSAGELGGTTLMPGVDIPGVGRVAVLRDPSGAAFQVMASETPPA
jgi:predicted enzyme related to lactoylglutathione lyase